MPPIPENLTLMLSGEEFLRSKSLKAIETDEDLSRHVHLIERSMNALNLLSAKPADEENEDMMAIRLLGMRLFNGCSSAFQLILSGYYQIAAMIMRDLLETVFLLGYFDINPEKISEWRIADRPTRIKNFGQVIIRTALDENNNFSTQKRRESYQLLCELASHPTFMGFQMLAPKGHDHHCGPFFEVASLNPLIEELVKLAAQSGTNYNVFIEGDTKVKIEAKIGFMEALGEWAECYYKRPFDPTGIDELRALLEEIINSE